MSELADALDKWDHKISIEDWSPIVDAARRVANPDYDAATKVLHRARYDDPLNVVAREVVDAAFGITEDTDD